jgi:hypothetical protein
MGRLQALALSFPEAAPVDIDAWHGEPTFAPKILAPPVTPHRR